MNPYYLKMVMHRNNDNLNDLASALNICRQSLYMKMRYIDADKERKQEFTQSEIRTMAKRYQLTPDEIVNIFFS